ncbi:MAG: pyruvate kinase [Acidobacteria bacterium]|nr:pyruvate kinase [Acidobacteriota bacterium]
MSKIKNAAGPKPATAPFHPDTEFERLIEDLTFLRNDLRDCWAKIESRIENFEGRARDSARNLVHYVALRRHDLRALQSALARHGISSLGRSESHVMANIGKALKLLHRILGKPNPFPSDDEKEPGPDEGDRILRERTDRLLGKKPPRRKVRIMVTLPGEAADDRELVRELIAGGMDCARINCAHDSPAEWSRMIGNIRQARDAVGRECRICIDIAGPKLRTGALEPGPRVLKLRPVRDAFGRVVKAARIRLTPAGSPDPAPAAAQLKMTANFLSGLRPGDNLKFRDARAARRVLTITETDGRSLWAECRQTAYITPETNFVSGKPGRKKRSATAGEIPPREQFITLRRGDRLILTKTQKPGRPARLDENGLAAEPARIPCSLPGVFDFVRPDEQIWFDDGRIGGRIAAVGADEMVCEITHPDTGTRKLRAAKGINFPDSDLRFPSLTAKDLKDLEFIVRHADFCGYSFVRSAADVVQLRDRLKKLGGEHLGVVLKIETRQGFDHLPEILLTALTVPSIGVMIARGDLAVETGFERLAEVQEEILWICEAAHVPVIWATQVLEELSKDGIYSRAEITDAAMSERAECVMLNKGAFIVEAVRALGGILERMESHQEKKRPLLRHLCLADKFFEVEKKPAQDA